MVFSVLLRGDLGERKVKFRSKRAICGGFEGFGNQPPHPPTFGRNLPKKTSFVCLFFGGAPLLESNEGNILC